MIIKLTPNLVISARGLLQLTQQQLADAAGLNRQSIIRAESAEGPAVGEDTLKQIQNTLEKLGVEFLNGGSPGVRLVKREPSPVPSVAD